MAIFIEWTEETGEFLEWRYAGDGVTEPVFKKKIVTKRARYSNTVTDDMIERANAYVKADRPDAKVVVLDQ